jgi:formate hydrogenlyase subunit 3/multisubunit Na+/H+ antiporter MnhD subunit
MTEWINASWIIALLGIFAVSLSGSGIKGYAAASAILLSSAVTSWLAVNALIGQPLDLTINAGIFLGDIPIRIDQLSAWFILIINFTSITGAFFGTGYLKVYENAPSKLTLHWSLFVLFHLSMVWVCMVQNGFAFLIVWEIMSLSSMLLVIFDNHHLQTLKAGLNYLVQMHISVVFLTVGFIWVYSKTGSLSFDAIRTFFQTNNNLWPFLVFFVGFGFKAGFIPLHSWLPHAHPAAPSHVSGVMSGVIVKLGIYGIFRTISYLQSDFNLLGEIIITLSVLTGIYGILNASVHRDYKRMLAYCTIENIGIIGIGIGIGLIGIGTSSPVMYFLGFGGALLHVLNHSLFKSLLFYSAGSIFQQTHTRDMEQLGGLLKSMPKTALLFLVGAIAIGGLPPFNGFISEFIIYSGLIEGIHSNSMYQIILMILVLAGLCVIGGLSVMAFTKTYGTLFLGQPRKTLDHQPHEVSRLMLVPQYLIIALMLSIAFVPQFYLNAIGNILLSMRFPISIDTITIAFYSGSAAKIGLISLIFIGLICLFWLIRATLTRKKPQATETTWGCGYVAPNSSMQYSGKSFTKPVGKLFNSLLIEKKNFEEFKPEEIFPEKRKYDSNYVDFFESNFIDKITKYLIIGAGYFRFIQNGRTQSYVLYGILFILIMFLLTIFNLIK